jgi:hypothetical protein
MNAATPTMTSSADQTATMSRTAIYTAAAPSSAAKQAPTNRSSHERGSAGIAPTRSAIRGRLPSGVEQLLQRPPHQELQPPLG